MNKENIKKDLMNFLKKGNPLIAKEKKLPLDKSLVEIGLMDSFGVIDTITFLEKKYNISIEDDEISKEKFGSFNKMVNLTYQKMQDK